MEDVNSPERHQGTSQYRNQFVWVPLPLRPTVLVLPRSKDNVYVEGSTEEFKDLLPDFQPSSEGGTLRRLEERFYVDIATQRDGTYMGHRKVTAVVRGTDDQPLADKGVEWRRTEGSSELRFVDANDQLQQELTGSDAPTTDANGMVEVTVAHPSHDVAPGDEGITIEASVEGTTSTLEMTLTRNAAVGELDNLARRDDEDADLIWVYQPDEDNRPMFGHPGIEELQEVLNEVVARHRDVDYDFVPLDGIFGDKTRTALQQYLEHFVEVPSGEDSPYPYDLSEIGISQDLKDYVRAEYAPFDPDERPGWIVDRRLLIGNQWDLAADQIDGLLELKEGVVDRLKDEMVRMANEYIDCDTFWLHRPIHDPYQQAADHVFRITEDGPIEVKTAPNRDADILTDTEDTHYIVAGAGDLFPSPDARGGWVEINHPAAGDNGWVRANTGRRIRDDQGIDRNAGTHGNGVWADGVAYSYGCKDLPDTYTERLEDNPHAPPEDGAGNQGRIANWSEYAEEHKVGRRMQDGPDWPANNQGPNRIPFHTGCDCSGFTQHCITEAVFPAPHDDTRVVPNAVVAQITFNRNHFPVNSVGASAFVGVWRHADPPRIPNPVARPVPDPGSDPQEHWVRQGDVIASNGHIVWVAEEEPNMLNGNITFEVFNEYGGDGYDLENGNRAPVDTNRFLRKALRMPFHYWRQTLPDIGKVYIWYS